MTTNKKYIQAILIICLLLWFSFFLFQKINFITADLGRFIKNGELIFNADWSVLKTNFYSYTYPQYPFTNHHWLTGVVFYLLWRIGGFTLLHLFFVSLTFASFLLLFKIAKKESGFKTAAFLSLLLIPLIAYRREIRPEIFSCFFSAVFFYILWRHKNKYISNRWLFLLPALQILWVNSHIYFFLGICVFGAFFLEEIVLSLKNKKKFPRQTAVAFSFCCLSTLLNPFGIKGALHPLLVYKNYGYRVLEEQSVWFLEKLNINNPNFTFFKIILATVIISFIVVLIKNRRQFSLTNFFLAGGLGAMACLAVRNISLFSLFMLPVIGKNAGTIFSKTAFGNFDKKMLFTLSSGVLLIMICAGYNRHLPAINKTLGIGLMPGINNSAVFFKENNLKGRILNNYDIGGYLIYHLYPEEKVFVDNRPEAYPADFFQKIYIPLQENKEVFEEQDKKYNFNAIFFHYRDSTPWAQKFLIEKINDLEWAPVFADNYAIIFLKRNEKNKNAIEKFEIPKNNFVTK